MNLTQDVTGCPLVFFADVMLGKLARWLRMLGYDTAYERKIDDADLVNRVLQENRWLLTRDRYLVGRKILKGRHTLIHSDGFPDQLRQLQHELHIKLIVDADTVCRCAHCNQVLEPIASPQAAPYVPQYVAKHHVNFASCPNCRRLYWDGTHWADLQQRLQQLRRG